MSGLQLSFENLTFNDFQNQLNINRDGGDIGDSASSFANIFYGAANSNISFEFNITNYSLLLDNLSRAFNISPANLSHYINDTIYTKRESGLHGEALTIVTVITVFYSIIFISGIIGNLITCIVISRNKYMHTATNFYLFNLAISDLLLLTSGLPQEIYSLWNPRSYPFSDFVCILESTLLETAANVTVLTITAFSVERYIAICHPFRQHSMSKLSRAIKFIMAIWITAFVLALPQAMQFAVIVDQGSTCTLKNLFYGHVFAVSGCVFFVGPMTAICVLYVLIGRKLKKSKLLQGVKRYDKGISAQTRVIRMLIAVAVAFFLCWAPFHAQRLMAVYGSTQTHTTELFNKAYHILNHVSGVMYYLSTCINPLLYNIMSHKFRNAFKLTLARQCGLYRAHQAQNNNYYCAIPRQQNSSMRLGNMSGLDHHHHRSNTMQLNKRESGLSLLHDNNMNSSNRTSVRSGSINNHYRCVSVSSQSTLMTTLGKNDVYSTVANVTPNRNHHHHIVNNTTAYCNSNSSSFSSKTNRPINSTSSTGCNNCSPTCTPDDDLQISSIDDNLDELADCHRLKNVQRYQNPVILYMNNNHNKNQQQHHRNNQDQYVTDNSNSDNEIYNTQQQQQQQSTVTILNDQSGKSATTVVSVILPSATTKKLKSSGSNGSGFRKSFESHPNSMMALNNGISVNQTALIINSNNVEKEILTNDQNIDDDDYHFNQHQDDNKKNKKEYNNAINNTISKIAKNEIIYNRQNSITTSDDIILSGNTSSNLSNSCSSNSNSSNLYNKCYKLSSSSSSSSASLSSIQKTKLNNELPSEMNNISIINCDRINQQSIKPINDSCINRIQNILTNNSNSNSNCNLTKSNSFNNINTNLVNSQVKNDLNHRNLTKNSALEQQQQSKMILPIETAAKTAIEPSAENSNKNFVKLNSEPAQI